MKASRCPILIFVVLWITVVHVQAQKRRLALLIGNSDYHHVGALPNPRNDVRAMDSTLQRLGFITVRYEDVSQSQMKRAIDQFGQQLKKEDIGLFYYAGHGLQFQGRNYLVPVDANLQMEKLVEFDCVPVDRVLAHMEVSGTAVNLLILDACRNNPFQRSWTRSTESAGLAFMNAPSGSLIAYATSPGSVASDGTGRNGLYTEALLRHMATPNLTVEQVFKRVRADLEVSSEKRQVPWESTSLKGDFYFFRDSTASLVTVSAQPLHEFPVGRGIAVSRQHEIRVNARYPLQASIGYDFFFSKRFSARAEAGMLGLSNSFLFVGQSEQNDINLMLRDSFDRGLSFSIGVQYHLHHQYVGVFAQSLRMKGATASSMMESQFNTVITDHPLKAGADAEVPQTLTLTSQLMQMGILYGRVIPFKDSRWRANIEFAISKTFASKSALHSNTRDLGALQGALDEQLDDWYRRYGFVPSLSIGISRTFGRVMK